jgi:hypothetical protein
MKISTKAALFSCFVFPGVGHFYLKRLLPGLLLSFVSAVAIYLITSHAVQVALEVVEEIQGGTVLPDTETISALVREKIRQSEDVTNISTISFIILWLIGIFDSYRIGRSLETKASATSNNNTLNDQQISKKR